nr:MAG TPA: hypothetical protein [Caudoviricetes sp.]
MKTSVPGVRSYVQNGITKYQVELRINDQHYQKRGFTELEEAIKCRKSFEEKYLPEKKIKVDSDDIVKTYLEVNSIRETAIQHHMSRMKVRKILITEGLYSTPESIKVNDLLKEGLSTEEVAKKLDISIGSVNNLAAYRKGEHNLDNPSQNALSIRKWREKN